MSVSSISIGIAGAGRVAQALGRHLREHGQPICQIASRSLDHARAAASFIGAGEAVAYTDMSCERVLVAVPDRAILDVTSALAITPRKPAIALHCCGAHGASLLETLRQLGVSCGALHPLQTFATADAGYRALPGSAFAIDGDADAVTWAEEIATMLDGMILRIPEQHRAIYHAAAAMASNHLTSVLDAAVAMMAAAGIAETDALRALEPIANTALVNTFALGPTRALTGPVERGDSETVLRHVGALQTLPPTVDGLYRAAGLHALSIARRRSLDPSRAERIEAILENQHAGAR